MWSAVNSSYLKVFKCVINDEGGTEKNLNKSNGVETYGAVRVSSYSVYFLQLPTKVLMECTYLYISITNIHERKVTHFWTVQKDL